jgi:hypothetical protein
VADGALMTEEPAILIGPAAAASAKAVEATATHIAAMTLDLIAFCISISFLALETGRTLAAQPESPKAALDK